MPLLKLPEPRHGRGFAVVADEIRSLAIKTQTSTNEIQNMINELQTSATKAEQAMESGRQLSAVCQDKAKSTGLVLEKLMRCCKKLQQQDLRLHRQCTNRQALPKNSLIMYLTLNLWRKNQLIAAIKQPPELMIGRTFKRSGSSDCSIPKK